MVIGSHNSWSYLRPQKWWARVFRFVARCQRVDIRQQYVKYGVRCFDLRVRLDEHGVLVVAHGLVAYQYEYRQLLEDLAWIDGKRDCYVRVIHEIRSKRKLTDEQTAFFRQFCKDLQETYRNIQFWCGRNLATWTVDYIFGDEPTCEERYSSVSTPRLIDDWWPWLYAWWHNDDIRLVGTTKDILLMDFVDV